jgi:hypothetical protein
MCFADEAHTGAMPAALRNVSKQRKEITVWGLQQSQTPANKNQLHGM